MGQPGRFLLGLLHRAAIVAFALALFALDLMSTRVDAGTSFVLFLPYVPLQPSSTPTPTTNTWTTAASMPTAREDLAAATGSDGRIYAIGGNNNNGVLNTVEAYRP